MRLRRQIIPGFGIRLKVLDYGVILAGLIAVVLVSLAVYQAREGELSVVIGGVDGEWIYPLSEDRRVEVPGPLGLSVVEIHDSHVHMDTSPCDNQTCVASGSIETSGQWIACLPNQVFIRIEGRGDDEKIDAAAY